MIGRVSIVKMSVLLILASRFNAIPIQITPGFFEELDNLVPKCIRTKARVKMLKKRKEEVRKEKEKKKDYLKPGRATVNTWRGSYKDGGLTSRAERNQNRFMRI